MKKERLDKVLVDRGLVEGRERAKALIMAGKVLVDGLRFSKAGAMVGPDSAVELTDPDIPFVGRGGLKLQAALDHFSINPEGMTAMDIGCSTGGFTDCLLQRKASKVYAIDVGYGQLHYRLRNDTRIVLLEKTNIRYLPDSLIGDKMDIIVIDVSFISLLMVLPRALDFLKEGGLIVALVKPQFEVGKADVGKGGIVKDESLRLAAVDRIIKGSEQFGLASGGFMESPIKGQKGNVEYLILLRRKND